MSGRAGRTGFDTRGDVVIVVNNGQQMKYTRDNLLQPFTAKLSSALTGSRLVRSLLEIVASQAVGSLYELGIFIKCTLKYELATLMKCMLCSSGYHQTQSLFE